jgi:hypothetical protein
MPAGEGADRPSEMIGAGEDHPHSHNCPIMPEQAAKAYIARRAKPSVLPGHVKLAFTLEMPRELAERLSARAIRDGVNLEAVVVERRAEVCKRRFMTMPQNEHRFLVLGHVLAKEL